MIILEIPFLRDDKIKEIAGRFRTRIKIANIPVPIDIIIEKYLGIDIVPIPGLQKAFDIEGFITSDFKCIYVDDYLFDKRYYYRYRFTPAHEIGHLIIHKKHLEAYSSRGIGQRDRLIFDSILLESQRKLCIDLID